MKLLEENCTVEQLSKKIIEAIAILLFLSPEGRRRNEQWLPRVLKEFEEQVANREKKKT